MKFLTIIVKYNDKINDLYKTLDSIERIKMHKEIETIIVSNNSNVKKEVINKYRHTIKIINAKGNLGTLYNKALELLDSNYVTFLNANDSFIPEGVIETINILKKESPNILKTNLKERYLDLNGKIEIGNLDTRMIETIRSYFFKVEFLKDNSFIFDSELNSFFEEDFYRRIFWITNYATFSISTCFAEYSVVRVKENQLSIYAENIDELYHSYEKCLNFLIDNNSVNVNLFVTRIIFSLYVIVCSFDFEKPTLKEKKEKYEFIIYSLYKKFETEFHSFDSKQLEQILGIEFERQRRNNIFLRLVENFSDFIDRMKYQREERDKHNHLLDIIIPEFNGEKYIFNLLNSISKQKNVDFSQLGVIIVDDCSSEEINPYKFKKYSKLNIDFIKNEKNVGPGLTRQHGIDNSKADFITFMDCDDEFYDDVSFAKILIFLKEHNPDIVRGCFAEEEPSGKKHIFKPDEVTQFLHGLYFKRQFLVDNNYRFNSRIRVAEDSYFTTIVLADNPAFLFNHVVYLWKYNKNSLVRTDNSSEEFHIKNIMDIIHSGYDAAKFLETKKSENIKKNAINSFLFPYVLLTSNVFVNVKKEDLKKYEMEAYKNYLYFKKYLNDVSKEEFNKYYLDIIKSTKRSIPDIITIESFDDFIARMAKEYPDL